jgi:hypothetical protein
MGGGLAHENGFVPSHSANHLNSEPAVSERNLDLGFVLLTFLRSFVPLYFVIKERRTNPVGIKLAQTSFRA